MNSEIDGELRERPYPMANMQSDMVKALRLVFTYLKTHELLLASQVCTSWKTMAMDSSLWHTVRLKNSMVCNWYKCIDTINNRGSVSLDLKHMLIPTKIDRFEEFWLDFSIALSKAIRLKHLVLYKCPPSVVEDCIYLLPQLTVVNATSIKNSNLSKEGKNPKELIKLSLLPMGKMTNLTDLRIKGLTGLELKNLPSLESLVNLKALSLTSIKKFPNDVCITLKSLSTSLEFLEIGDCNCLSQDFGGVIKRLTNLKSLRLVNCLSGFEMFAKEVFSSIRGLEKLKILELINIEFFHEVDELEKCTNIKALLIIPSYARHAATTNRHLINCLQKLSKTLTHLVWGLTRELLYVTEMFITNHLLGLDTMGYSSELLNNYHKGANNIPILRSRKRKIRPGEESVTDEDNQISDSDVDTLPVPALEEIIKKMMINVETRVVKIPFQTTTRVYLFKYFKGL